MGKQYLNGVLYGTGEIIKFSPYIYSLEEREIGVWTDGKPLYQKTITGLSFYTSVSNWASTGATLTDVDRVVMCEIGQSFSSLIEICFARVENDILKVWTTNNETYEFNIVNIQYTKTTDTPGSGHYTTTGDKAHHYSTTEQVIGTWVDGSTIYEKTIDCGSMPNNETKQVAHGISNIGKILSVSGFAYNSSGTSLNLPYLANDFNYMITISCNSTNISITARMDRSSFNGYLTVQYTKVTT